MILIDRLKKALKRINPWLNDNNLNKAVNQIRSIKIKATNLIEANEQIYQKLVKHISLKLSISISDGVVKVLKQVKKKQAELKLKYGEEYYSERNLVFCKARKSKKSIPGEPHNPGSVTRW